MGNEFWSEYNRLKNKKKKDEAEDIAPVRTSKVETSVDTDTESSFWSEYEKAKTQVAEDRKKDISKRSDDGKSIVPVNSKSEETASKKESKDSPFNGYINSFVKDALSDSEYKKYSSQGASIKNPTYEDASKGISIAGWRPFADEIGNPVTYVRDNNVAVRLEGKKLFSNVNYLWANMTDEEVSVYNYYLAKYGKDKAKEYLESIEEELEKREGTNLAKNVNGNKAAEIFVGAGAGLDNARQGLTSGVKNLVTGSEKTYTPSAVQIADQIMAQDNTGTLKVAHDVAYGVGNMTPSIAVGILNPAAGAATMGAGVAGNKYNAMIEEGYSVEEARGSAVLTGASEGLLQYAMGGIGKLGGKAAGQVFSKVAPNAAAVIGNTISNIGAKNPHIIRALGRASLEMGKEGLEEGLQTYLEPLIDSWVTGKEYEKPEFGDVVYNALIGALTSFGLEGAPGIAGATVDTATGKTKLYAREEAVVNRVVEDTIAEAEKGGKKLTAKEKNDIRERVQTDMERGRISTDTIEEVLGGDAYKAYTDAVAKEDSLRKEYADLGRLKNPTLAESTRYKELHDQRETFSGDENRNNLRGKVRESVIDLVKGTRLAESYAEQARRGEYFTDDLTTYKNEYARNSVENLVNSKAANNTNRTRELAETVAKIAQDKNITFDFTTDEKIKADGKAYISKKNITADGNAAVFDLGAKNLDADFTPVVTVNGKAVDGFKVDYENGTITFDTAPEAGKMRVEYRRSGAVNGYYDKQNRVVTVNLDSPKAWQFIVGHEVTHSLEGTDAYTELSRAITDYAKTKGDYDGRWDALSSSYNSGTDIDAEITSDLVGEYLFTDEAFVQHLSTNHRNVFQRIYDEIKHLYKMVTAGSKEARELEKVKYAFDKAWRAQAETSTENSGAYDEETDAQYSLVTDKETVDFLENQEHVKVYRAMQVIDGELYPPMAAVIPDGSKQLVEPTKQGEWYRADERPDLMIFSVKQEGKKARLLNKAEMKQNADVLYGNPQADDIITLKDGSTVTFGELTPKYNLDKGNKSTVPAAYNPYFHTSLAALNDQFSTAFKRPNLVVVEGYIPKSELTSGYQALYAKDSVGETEWHSGPVASALKGEKARKVFLSRWFKVGRIVSDAEAASMIAETLEGEGLSVPWNVVTPSLREALAAKGVDIDYKDVKLGSTTVTFDSTQDGVQYSLSVDSEGNKLTPEQQERFKDSKVRDENGNLKVMYHGTPNGDFTVFKDGTYFSDNKAYADLYQNPGASSLSVKKGASAPKTFEVYLDIKKPFDISDPTAREIYINDYIKGGNAVGINPYLSDAEYDRISSIDWTEGEDLRDFLQENGYDYDGLVLDEGATGGYGEDVKYRGKSYVVFSPEQVKSIDNIAPTDDPDIRFSLSTSVEETKDLMAIHNLHTSEVLKQIEMGGLVYPSVAITNPSKITHDDFGDVSLILKKDAIDPKNSKYNKIYSTDAYTPTFPHVSYEANSDVAESVSARVKAHFDKLPDYYQRSIRTLRDYTNLNDALNRWGGVGGMIDSYIDDHGMKQLYLAEKGESVPMVVDRTEAELTDYQKWMYQTVVDKLGEDEINALNDRGNFNTLGDARIAWTKEHLETIKDVFADIWSSDGTLSKEEALEIANEQKLFYWYKEATAALKYLENGGLTVVEKENIDATNAKIDEKIAGSDYKQWLNDLFSGIEGQSGIRNNKDTFLPSGKRRSFSQLHDPVTIDNVIKAMRKKGQQGEGAFGIGNIYGASAKTYGSIAETKKHSGELGVIEQAEYDAIKERVDNKLFDIAGRYSNGKDIIDAKNTLVEAVAKCESKSQIANYLKQFDYVYKYTDSIVDDLISLRDYIRSLPRPYFEAKPQRAVGFDEVGVFVIPRNADANLKQELLNRGYSVAEYDPDVEGDRAKVVNSFEEYKFSLSSDTAPVMGGNWRTPARDLRYEGAEDIAPSAPAEVATDTNAGRKIVSEADFAPIPEEVANATQDELLDSVRDEDAPPEMDAPYYGEKAEQAKPADPFAEKDIETVGKRSVKAYMYENPEVKPFFQKEANILLGELEHATKGERMHLWGDFDGYGAESYHRVVGVKRNVSPDIEYLLDTCHYTYAQIEKGIKAIIEDNGAENNAVSKRIEFILNDRLRDGYQDWEFETEIPPDDGYLNLLREKEITEYNEEAFKRLVETADDSVIPPAAEDIAPVGISEGSYSLAEESDGVEEKPIEAQRNDPVLPSEDNTPKRVKPTTAAILTEEPKPKNKKRGIWSLAKEYVLDNGMVFEEISKENNNRELEARWNSIRNAPKMAQYFIENGKNGIKSVNAVRKEVESRGLTRQFYEYMYHMHNIDRMSLESKAQAEAKQLLRENPMIAELTTRDTVDDIIAKIEHKTSQMSAEEALNSDLSKSNSDMRRNRKEVANELLEKVERYDSLMRVVNKPVFGKDVTADVSYAKVQELLKKNPELKRYAEDIYKNNRYLRNLMVEEGVISYETAKLWEEMYPHYVPIRREGDTGLNVNVPLDTRRTGINAPVKGATGGSRNILPLFDTMGVRAIQTYNAIAKNRFGIELKDTLGSTVDTNTATLDDAISTLDQSDGLLKAGENGMNPTFTVFENGERVTFEITDEMYDAMKPTGDVLSYTNKVANTASNLFRGLLTEYNPVFLAKNAIKDAQDVLINSQHPMSTYKAIPRAVWQMADKGKYYREYVENGGEQNTYFDRETTTFTKEGGAKEIAKTLLGLNLVSKANNIVEMTPRLAEYIASREAGRSIDVAMLDAARVTTNFAAGGKLTKFLNRNGATFLSASVNGAVQQARNIVEAKRNGLKGMLGLSAKFLAAGLPAIILNGLVWDDDEEYEELSDYVKQNYYIVGKYGDGKFVRIPKGRTVAVIQNAFEQMEHLVTGDDEADLGTFLELAVSNLAPNNPLDNNIIAPVKQVMENKTWYGEDLIPQRLQNLPAAEQYDESTDEISRWLGEKLNYSPYKINYLLNQYTGGVGDVVLPMLTPEAESGDDSIMGDLLAPVLSTFTTDSVMNNKNVSDFYDTKDKLTTNANSAAATDEDVLMSKYMNSINAELSGLYAQKREVQNSNLSDAEKYSEVRAIQSQIVDLTRKSLNTYEDIKYDGEYAVIGDRYFKRDDKGEWQKLTDDQVKKHTITSAAGNAYYATDGSTHYRWYVKDGETEGEWRKITDDELAKQNKVTSALGIDAKEYWRKKDEYDFAYKSPGKYAVSKAVGGYDAYKTYSSELYDIHADKDADGKSISGSRKDKVIDYINGMDADYGEKIILFKMEYPADDTYNNDIIDYLNSREDFTYEQIETILKELGFKVSDDGYITWD